MTIYTTENCYYVYQYLRSKTSSNGDIGSPYYIGKGKNRRAFTRHGKLPIPKNEDNIYFYAVNLSNEDALTLEIMLIARYGRLDLGTGILRNRTDGGEGTGGIVVSEDHRKKNSESHKGQRPWNTGKHWDNETKYKISKTQLNRAYEDIHGYEKATLIKEKISKSLIGRVIGPMSSSAKQKLSESQITRLADPAIRKQMSESHKGKPSPQKGQPKSELAKIAQRNYINFGVKINCEHCQGEFLQSHYTRFHGAKCVYAAHNLIHCEYCQQNNTQDIHRQWHGSKCKLSPDSNTRRLANYYRTSGGSMVDAIAINCEFCGTCITNPTNYVRWHGLKCKNSPDNYEKATAVDQRYRTGTHLLMKKECPYCMTITNLGNFAKHHGEKCKSKF